MKKLLTVIARTQHFYKVLGTKQSALVIPARFKRESRSPMETFGDDTSCQIAAPRFARLAMTFLCIILLFLGTDILFSEEIPQEIDGTVVSVNEASRRLVVDYEIPATGEHKEVEFEVGDGAGFKDFKKLSQLKKGDLVSLDYLDDKPLPKVIYMIRVPLEKTFFTRKEVAEALVKIKTNQKTSDAAKN